MNYAGIGSRSSTPEALDFILDLATQLRDAGWTLRTGGASGADDAFLRGAGDASEVYLPWQRYGGLHGHMDRPSELAFIIASQHHPTFDRCSAVARKLLARNAHILLGEDLQSPALMCIAWTPSGQIIGGTGLGIKIAATYEIPTFNLGRPADVLNLWRHLDGTLV